MEEIIEQQSDYSQQDNNSDSDYCPREDDESDSSCELSVDPHELPPVAKYHKWQVRIINWLNVCFDILKMSSPLNWQYIFPTK